MRRGLLMALYGLSGIGVAAALAWAAFTVAGHQLSTPADPIQPVGVVVTTASASPSALAKESPASPAQHHRSSPSPAVPAPSTPGAPTPQTPQPIPRNTGPKPSSPSPSPRSDDGHRRGDD